MTDLKNPHPLHDSPRQDAAPDSPDPLYHYLTHIVVLDTPGPLVYIGTLTEIGRDYLILTQADVHFTTESRTPKDLYVLESQELGVKVNRQRVVVMREIVASISLLSEVRD